MGKVKHTPEIDLWDTHILEPVGKSALCYRGNKVGIIHREIHAMTIVRACNSHKELVDALILSTDEHKKTQTHLQKVSGTMSKPLQDIIDRNNTIIEKAIA